MRSRILVVCLTTILCAIPSATAGAEPAPVDLTVRQGPNYDPVTAQIESALADLSKPCERLRNRSFWAEATSLATASVAAALGGGSFIADGNLELALRLTGVVLSGISAGAAYLGRAYGGDYRERCSAEVLLDKGDEQN